MANGHDRVRRDAITLARSFEPHIAVLDIGLPDVGGLEVLDRLRAVDPAVGVMFLTARDSLDDRLIGLRAGGDDYVTKPFSLEEVIARAEGPLRRRGLTVRHPRT